MTIGSRMRLTDARTYLVPLAHTMNTWVEPRRVVSRSTVTCTCSSRLMSVSLSCTATVSLMGTGPRRVPGPLKTGCPMCDETNEYRWGESKCSIITFIARPMYVDHSPPSHQTTPPPPSHSFGQNSPHANTHNNKKDTITSDNNSRVTSKLSTHSHHHHQAINLPETIGGGTSCHVSAMLTLALASRLPNPYLRLYGWPAALSRHPPSSLLILRDVRTTMCCKSRHVKLSICSARGLTSVSQRLETDNTDIYDLERELRD